MAAGSTGEVSAGLCPHSQGQEHVPSGTGEAEGEAAHSEVSLGTWWAPAWFVSLTLSKNPLRVLLLAALPPFAPAQLFPSSSSCSVAFSHLETCRSLQKPPWRLMQNPARLAPASALHQRPHHRLCTLLGPVRQNQHRLRVLPSALLEASLTPSTG